MRPTGISGACCRWAWPEGDNWALLDEPKLWHGRADHLGNVRRDEMGIVPLGHARVRMAEIGRDHRQRCPSLQQMRGIGVTQNMKAGRRIDPGTAAGFAQGPVLVRPSPP
jgi:hypothetical protein